MSIHPGSVALVVAGVMLFASVPSGATAAPTAAVIQPAAISTGHICKPAKTLAQKRAAWRKSRNAILEIAKKQSNYTGYVVTKKGQGLSIYGTSKPPKVVLKAMMKAKKASGLIVRWSASADYNRKELRSAANTLLADRRVNAVRISPTDGGYLAVDFKRSVRLPKYLTAMELGDYFGVGAPVVEIADAVPAN